MSGKFARLWQRQRGRCWICKCPMIAEPGSSYSATFDHIRPKSLGGKNGIANLKLAHQVCNLARGAPLEYPGSDRERSANPRQER